jgi:hypothetical protein
MARSASSGADELFRRAVAGLAEGRANLSALRPEVRFTDEPAPRRLAPYATAMAAAVSCPASPAVSPAAGAPQAARSAPRPDPVADVGWGRFVLLYDPAGQDGWAGPLRIVAYIQAELDPEIAEDPLIGRVGWSWLTEALDARADHRLLSGTVTRVVTEGFGGKQDEPAAIGLELRASWSPARPGDAGRPLPELAGHLAAWCDTLCAASGLPPLTPGVRALPRRSRLP